jgi:hypothetical protein
MLSRSSRCKKFQAGSGMCLQNDKFSVKQLSEMEFREKKEMILKKVYITPKNPSRAFLNQAEKDTDL